MKLWQNQKQKLQIWKSNKLSTKTLVKCSWRASNNALVLSWGSEKFFKEESHRKRGSFSSVRPSILLRSSCVSALVRYKIRLGKVTQLKQRKDDKICKESGVQWLVRCSPTRPAPTEQTQIADGPPQAIATHQSLAPQTGGQRVPNPKPTCRLLSENVLTGALLSTKDDSWRVGSLQTYTQKTITCKASVKQMKCIIQPRAREHRKRKDTHANNKQPKGVRQCSATTDNACHLCHVVMCFVFLCSLSYVVVNLELL